MHILSKFLAYTSRPRVFKFLSPAKALAAAGVGLSLLCASPRACALTTDLLSPENGLTNIAFSPSLAVNVTDSAATNLTATFFGRPVPNPIRTNFTIVALPDTQCYSGEVFGGTPEMFTAQTEWIITNRVERNIVFVTQLGDCVQNGEYEWQWLNATNSLYRLEDPVRTELFDGIPYGICPGGHDQYWPYPDTFTLYNKYFGVPHFQGKSYYSGNYGTNNDNHFEFISVSGIDLMFLHLQWDAGRFTNVMDWANSVLQTNLNRRAIVVTHSLLNGNTAEFNAQGQPIYDALKANTNIILMLCGHHPFCQSRSDTYNGHTIRTIVSDFTSLTNGGSGYLRTMEFSPSNGTMHAQSYSPFLDDYIIQPRTDFTLGGFDLSPSVPNFTPIQVLSNVPPGIITSDAWTGLVAGQVYEWYVVLSDGETNHQSATWTFTTSDDYTNNQPPPPDNPDIVRLVRLPNGPISVFWNSRGGGRYRVEYKNDLTDDFTDLVRSATEETDPSPPGKRSIQGFTDDFSQTGGPPATSSRFYRIKRVE